MGALFDSAHAGMQHLIDVNPVLIRWNRRPLIDNGRGALIPDAQAEPEERSAWGRISRQAGGVQDAGAAATGHTTNLSMYLILPPEADLREGDVITAETGAIRKWKTGVVDELYIEGECYGKQAPLTRADGGS